MLSATTDPPTFLDRPLRVDVVLVHPALRDAVVATIAAELDMLVIGSGSDAVDAAQRLHVDEPDVLVIDRSLVLGSGALDIAHLHARRPQLAVVVVGIDDDRAFSAAARRAGAAGYVALGDVDSLLHAIRCAAAGRALDVPAAC